MPNKLFAIVLLFLVFNFKLKAQEKNIDTIATNKISTLSGTLAEQYVQVVVRSGSYKVYKNIKKTKIEEFWKNINDTLEYQRQLIQKANTSPSHNNKTITDLKAKIDSLENVRLEPIKSSNEESSNTTYLWISIFGLSIALIFALLKTRLASKEANHRTELYEQLSEEIREQRMKATEREKKLGRELQTERNRVEELLEKLKK